MNTKLITSKISSKSNAQYQQWLDYAHVPRKRRAAGVVWLEGEHAIAEAIQRGAQVQCIVYAQGSPPALSLSVLDLPVFELTPALFKTLSTLDTPSNIAAVVTQPTHELPKLLTETTVVLDGVQDPGNVGTIIRLCAAFGVRQVILGKSLDKSCAEAWSPKAMRAGQGAQFAVNVYSDIDLTQFYAGCAMPIIATALRDDAVALPDFLQKNMAAASPAVWVFGNEGQGVSRATLAAAAHCVKIPMRGGFESLNIASAAAIILYEMSLR